MQETITSREINNPRHSIRAAVFLAMVAAVTVAAAAAAGTVTAQIKEPYSKEKLLNIVRLNGLSTQETVGYIQRRGVSFQMTPIVEDEFRAAGARPEVIAAVRANYRPAGIANRGAAAPAAGRNAGAAAVPPGPPLSKAEVITLLQSGLTVPRVEQFVQARGVSFRLTPPIIREIRTAGGNNSLIGAITAGAGGRVVTKETPAAAAHSIAAASKKSAPDYDDLTDQAIALHKGDDTDGAIRLLEQAIEVNAAQPTAHQLLGFVQLYGKRNIGAAAQSMRAAIERGGSAAFRVYHDHAKGLFTDTCDGSLFVTKSGVTFKADNGRDTFEAQDVNIDEIKTNRLVGSDRGAFHIKVKGERNYNFAPLTKKKEESKLIIELVKGYGT